ncbi:winged helix-turn-helix domain-containing protein [Kribbella sp. NPDC056861]|uniref:GntR family transcriptional regulator n=1 Tax=Kribbella sp. NPDC056861 TaxID=3154857 RepID=UPI00343CD2D6
MAIDRENAQPLQAQVADDIRRRIAAGEFSAGAKLPPLRALTTEYDVAEMTVHAAIRELQRQGLVISSRGRGTFVSDDIDGKDLSGTPGVYDPTSPEAQIEELRRIVADLVVRVDRLESHDD